MIAMAKMAIEVRGVSYERYRHRSQKQIWLFLCQS